MRGEEIGVPAPNPVQQERAEGEKTVALLLRAGSDGAIGSDLLQHAHERLHHLLQDEGGLLVLLHYT